MPNPLSRKVRLCEPYSLTHRFKVAEDFVGESLLAMMSSRFSYRSELLWRDKIEKGLVGVNDNQADPAHRLTSSDEVYHHNHRVVEPSVPDEIRIVMDTDDYLAVYKPAPMPMHPGGRFNKNTLTNILEREGYQGLKIVHRLDAVTSGLVLFARNKESAKEAMKCFRDGKVQKTYCAHVSGVPKIDAITIDAPIRRKIGFVFESEPGLSSAKQATTHFEVLQRHSDSAVIKCEPVTGRTHQIRLHLEQWGYPIIDDPIYGVDGDKSSKRTQNIGIGLVNVALRIDPLAIDLKIDYPTFSEA